MKKIVLSILLVLTITVIECAPIQTDKKYGINPSVCRVCIDGYEYVIIDKGSEHATGIKQSYIVNYKKGFKFKAWPAIPKECGK